MNKTTNPVTANAITKAPCHYGNVHVFDYTDKLGNTVQFYGGGTTRGSLHTSDFLLISLQSTDNGDVAEVSFKNLEIPSLKAFCAPRIIKIAIPDGGQPGFPLQFWEELLRQLAVRGEDKLLKVLVRCAGGHGRTGVVLCALAVAAGVTQGADPIAWLRQRYCTEAVETEEQFDYIEWLSGVPSKEPMRPFSFQWKTPGIEQAAAFGLSPVTSTTPGVPKPKGTTSTSPSATGTPTAVTTGSKVLFSQPTLRDKALEEIELAYLAGGFPVAAHRYFADNECTKEVWMYEYNDSNDMLESDLPPFVGGAQTDGTLNGRKFWDVVYGSGVSVLMFDDDTGVDGPHNYEDVDPPAEEEVDYAQWYDCGAHWLYHLHTGEYLILTVPPTVCGEELVGEKWSPTGREEDARYVDLIRHMADGSVELILDDESIYKVSPVKEAK